MRTEIDWQAYEKIELRVGTVKEVRTFPEAHQPAYILVADFGEDIGLLKTSARITDLYHPRDLEGRQVVGLVNLPPRQIGPIISQFRLMGFYREDNSVVLAMPEQAVPNGAKLL